MSDEPKRNLLQSAIHNVFAVWLGITPPSPGQELFYGALLVILLLAIFAGGYFGVRALLSATMG